MRRPSQRWRPAIASHTGPTTRFSISRSVSTSSIELGTSLRIQSASHWPFGFTTPSTNRKGMIARNRARGSPRAPFEAGARTNFDMILATKHGATDTTRGSDVELLLDIDLSILGASPSRFAEYEAQVRFEYAWVPVETYIEARARILRRFYDRQPLYRTAHVRNRIEVQAKENLAVALKLGP
jgi:hypothetical protein